MKKLKIEKIEKIGIQKVNDLTVENVNHYISENGIINHNSGPQYAASIMILLSKAQLKEGDSKTGIIVTATTEKNRFARPEKVKFHIHYKEGMNPYVGLHEYLSWENCGIANGKIINEAEYEKLYDKYGDKNATLFNQIASTVYEINGVGYYYLDINAMKKFKMTGIKKFAVKHLATEVEAEELFTERVFNEETLKMLDETVIKDKFSYGVSTTNDLGKVFETEENKEESDLMDDVTEGL